MIVSPGSPNARRGSELREVDQIYVLAAYVHRFTRDHVPAWPRKIWKDGKTYPLQFDSDLEWLENTWFAVRKNGSLDGRVKACWSMPTWPDNPELRPNAATAAQGELV